MAAKRVAATLAVFVTTTDERTTMRTILRTLFSFGLSQAHALELEDCRIVDLSYTYGDSTLY
ncbi:MAG: hypothetical protein AAF417_20565 [Pseudomonadota bacterium]